MTASEDSQTKTKPDRRRTLALLWRLMGAERGRYGAAIGALAAATLLGYAEPLIPALVIDGLIQNHWDGVPAPLRGAVDQVGGAGWLAANLWLPATVLVVIMALAALAHHLKARWAARATENITRDLRDRLYDHLQHLPSAYHDQAETGDVVQRCTSDVETLRLFLSTQVVEIGRAILMLLLVLPFMLMLNPLMTGVALFMMPVLVVFAVLFFRKVRHRFKQADEAEGHMTARLQENLTAIRVVRAFANQDHEKQRFAVHNVEYRDHQFKLYRVMAWYWSSSDLLCLSQVGLVLMVGAWLITRGELSVGELFAFVAYVNMLLWPVRQLGRVLSEAGKATVAIDRIGEILEKSPEADPADAPEPERDVMQLPVPVEGAIAFEHVSFTHLDGAEVLRDVSFAIEPGQTLALLGPSGSGKSTIIHLLLRLHDPKVGVVRLDGRDITRVRRKDVRSQFGVVMQEPFLYSKSVRENIRLARPGATDDAVIDAATVAHVHENIAGFDDGYETLVGERGVKLSGGQRQRLAIARAVMADPPVLVLDDALSAVDTETERVILGALRQRRHRRTTIVIAHRLSTVMHADLILVLDHGRIVQHGTHVELSEQEGLYRRLWHIQHALEEDFDASEKWSSGPVVEWPSGQVNTRSASHQATGPLDH